MRLVVKEVDGETHEFMVEESSSVADLKHRLADYFRVSSKSLRIIHKGGVLADNWKMSRIGPDGFVICNVVMPQIMTEAAYGTHRSIPDIDAEEGQVLSDLGIRKSDAVHTGRAYSGDEESRNIGRLMEMGFGEGDCRAALRAQKGDVSAAANFLIGTSSSSSRR
jgi:hypothetical protein